MPRIALSLVVAMKTNGFTYLYPIQSQFGKVWRKLPHVIYGQTDKVHQQHRARHLGSGFENGRFYHQLNAPKDFYQWAVLHIPSLYRNEKYNEKKKTSINNLIRIVYVQRDKDNDSTREDLMYLIDFVE